MKLYAARDKNTGKLVSDLITKHKKFWQSKKACQNAIENYNNASVKYGNYDLELIVYELVEINDD